MNLQGRDLKREMRGEDVARLQRELTVIGYEVPAEELRASFFGDKTLEAVSRFQKERGMATTGIVDTHTALAINAAVEVETITVEGRVASRTRAGTARLQIDIVDRNVGEDLMLAHTVTDDDGCYETTFSIAALRERGKSRPDLQARALLRGALLGASDVRYNAARREALDIVVDETAEPALPSEHESLTEAIFAHYKGRLGDLQESEERSDITYLGNKTGWDARAVALAALADQFSARTAAAEGAGPLISPVFFYALFRAGLPADENALYRADAAALETVWKQAAEQGVIPDSAAGTIPEVVRHFQTLSAGRLLRGPAASGGSSLKEMLAGRLDEAQQQQFAALLAANRGATADFWNTVTATLGQETSARLQLDGKLAFLTINNAPLMQKLHGIGGDQGIADPLQLAQMGYHRAGRWSEIMGADTPVPPEIPGETPEAKRENYAQFLAAQVRLSYPTAAVAQMVGSDELPVRAPEKERVHDFLRDHQGRFEIGAQPVGRYLAQNGIEIAPETRAELGKLQRVYQITPDDQAMTGLLKRGVHAAYHVVRYGKDAFVRGFAADLGGTKQAALTYEKSLQVHHAALNIAVSYLTARNGIPLGAAPTASGTSDSSGSGQVLRPVPEGPSAENAAGVIAYPTLEQLFGAMDFCECEHCRSVLSPAAYLVDLLHFLDREPSPEEAQAGTGNPQAVLLARRPDIQHLPLTCDNTNTALPYIDVVNETLEYFIANTVQPLSLQEYAGHDTDGVTSEDLLANPQFVIETAYTLLREERFPPPLPFHRPLESMRRIFDTLGVPLARAMERLRKSDALERGGDAYAWRDILMEEIGLSREEYEILTDATAVPLRRMYGFAGGTSDEEVIAELSHARRFARRVGITYEELIAVLKTRFVNPNSGLVSKLERLGVPFAALQALHDGTIGELPLPTGTDAPDPAHYGGDITAWVKNPDNFARIMAIITLTDPNPAGHSEGCDFDTLELRYTKPPADAGDTSTRLGTVEYIRLMRFIRLWRKTGWTIAQTDTAIRALYRVGQEPFAAGNIDTVQKLDAGFRNMLPELGVAVRVIKAFGLYPDLNLAGLLACWSEIDTHGEDALYRQMFLSAGIPSRNAAFADDGYGNFPGAPNEKISVHKEALRAAFALTSDEFDRILTSLGFDDATPLTLANISAVYRRGWLARALHISVRELILFTTLADIDPFVLPDPVQPAIITLGALMQTMKANSLKPAAALYLIWNQDLGGKSAPNPAQILSLARSLRADFAGIDDPSALAERKRRQALQRIGTAASVDPAFAQTLLDPETKPYPLHAAGDPDRPAMDDVLAVETRGLAAQFFFRDTATGTADVSVSAAENLDYTPGIRPLPANPTAGAAISGIWRGFVETPEPGGYHIAIEADDGSTVSLSLDGKMLSLTQDGIIRRNDDPMELKAGTLHTIELKVEKVKDRLSVMWETPTRPREAIPARCLIPSPVLARFSDATVRFLKSAALAAALRLTAGEIAHFATGPDAQVTGDRWLNVLPVDGDASPAVNAALLTPLETLLGFARIKADLSPDDEQVLTILKNPAAAAAAATSPLFALTRWDRASLTAVLEHFGVTIDAMARFDVFRRVYGALDVIQPIGVGGAALIRAATNAPDDDIAGDFLAALHARYAVFDRRELIKPINDAMRGLQRDALVASILHKLRENPATAQIDTSEKLFEHFLMDVQTAPCMLTSRVRHALSSVQLFTERCLMNLEPQVSPSFVNGEQWAWMKRYRIWEANRKVFLWPENWLEPELRDDKSSIFKELESKLLQSDITEESAAGALLDYLSGLEEVAKLEPCGIHYIEPTSSEDERMHVVARTAGAKRKYFYRRFEYGTWTSWEQIKLDIEDNPVMPVVWKGRLLLFWLRLMIKGPDAPARPPRNKPLTGLTTNDLPSDPEMTVQALLSWSEYFNGKWQPAKTSAANLPTTLISSSSGRFERARLQLGVSSEGDVLRVFINDTPIPFNRRGKDGRIHLVYMWPGSFRLYNTHSLPVRGDEFTTEPLHRPSFSTATRIFAGDRQDQLSFQYTKPGGADFTREILSTRIPFEVVTTRHELKHLWEAPVFFSDSRHAFLVTTEEETVPVRDYGSYGIFERPDVLQTAQTELVVPTAPSPKPKFWGDAGPIVSEAGTADPAAMRRLIMSDATIRRGLPITRNIRYGNTDIGPSGAVAGSGTER